MEFRTAVIASLDRLIASKKIEAAIDSALEKCVQTIVNDELRSYSDFGKRLTEVVKKSLALNGDIDLPSYNDTILKIVRRQVESMTNALIQKQVAENLEDLLRPAPESIKLTELVNQYIEQVKDHQSAGCVYHGESEITLRITENDFGFKYVSLDAEANKSRHECDIEIGITKEGEVFTLRFRDGNVEKAMFAGPFYGFERMLFQMKAAKSKLIFDAAEWDIETTYGYAD